LDEAISSETYLLANDDFIVIEHDSCDSTDLNRLYFVAFVTQKHKDIYSVRDLRGRHVGLLKEIFNETVRAISKNFEVDVSDLRVFVHYVPSIFRLHVHFCSVEMVKSSVLVGRAIQVRDFAF
jgi:m7GpppX diphosphatase